MTPRQDTAMKLRKVRQQRSFSVLKTTAKIVFRVFDVCLFISFRRRLTSHIKGGNIGTL